MKYLDEDSIGLLATLFLFLGFVWIDSNASFESHLVFSIRVVFLAVLYLIVKNTRKIGL